MSTPKQPENDVPPIRWDDIEIPWWVDDPNIAAWKAGIRAGIDAVSDREDLLRQNLWQMREMMVTQRDKAGTLETENVKLRSVFSAANNRKRMIRKRT